ncbi:MAG TPA: cadherin domain-containing protein [Candidatus Competibacteraceae bacterium]|nr:cadherin domain-containing protein [Candidatus Competibacteraceae bacterium]
MVPVPQTGKNKQEKEVAMRFSPIVLLAALLTLAPVIPLQAAQYSVLIDNDLNPATGCSVTLSNSGTVNGIEHRLSAQVTGGAIPQVSAITLESCQGSSLTSTESGSGAVGLNVGTSGADAVEMAVADSAVVSGSSSGPRNLAVYFAAQDANGDDLIGPGLLGIVVGIPSLTGWGLLVLAGLLTTLAFHRLRRGGFGQELVAVALLLTAGGMVVAANFATDGNVADWNGVSPLGTDPNGDGGDPVTDLVAGFGAQEHDRLFFRFDVTNLENAAPQVDPASFSLAEHSANGTAVGSVTFTDADAAQSHGFAITAGNVGGAFAIDPSSGLITVANDSALDFETTPTFTLTVQVTDNGSPALSGSGTVTVSLSNVNEPPVISAPPAAYAVQAHISLIYVDGTGDLLDLIIADPEGGPTPFVIGGAVPSTTANGGSLNIDTTTGAFTYNPPAGFIGSDSFEYQICDTDTTPACSLPVTATLDVSGPRIWFVNNAAAAGDGRLSSPFNSLAAADSAANQNGDRIFVYASGTSYIDADGVSLQTNQYLIGQGASGASFDAVMGITPPVGSAARPSIGGSRPTIVNTVNLAPGVTTRGFNVSTSGASTGLFGSGASGMTINEVSVASAGAPAVDLTNSGGTLSFTRIDANGGANGIKLTNTSGSFTITGSGSINSGGILQNNSSDAVALNGASNVSLSWMRIQDSGRHGIYGTRVVGFTLSDSIVQGAGDGNDESGLYFADPGNNNLSGNALIRNSMIDQPAEAGLYVHNFSGTLNLTVDNSDFTNTIGQPFGEDGLRVIADGTSTITLRVYNGSTFSGLESDGIAAFVQGTFGATLNATIDGNTFIGGASSDNALAIRAAGTGLLRLNLDTNRITNMPNTAVLLTSDESSNFHATVSNNAIGIAGVPDSGSVDGNGISMTADDTSVAVLDIRNNIIHGTDFEGIYVLANDGTGQTPRLDVNITGNEVAKPDDNSAFPLGVNGIFVFSMNQADICADIRSNIAAGGTGIPPYDASIQVAQYDASTFRLERLNGGSGMVIDPLTVSTHVASENSPSTASAWLLSAFTGVPNDTCATPTAAPLP